MIHAPPGRSRSSQLRVTHPIKHLPNLISFICLKDLESLSRRLWTITSCNQSVRRAIQRSLCLRVTDIVEWSGVASESGTPDHSTLSNTRNRLPQEVFAEVFQFVLKIAAAKQLIAGKTVGVDSTTLEANAAMKSIVRRDTGVNGARIVQRLAVE